MRTKKQLEERLAKLVEKAREGWREAYSTRVVDCVVRGDHTTIRGKNKKEICLDSAIRINRGEFIIYDEQDYPDNLMIYSPELEYQLTWERASSGGGLALNDPRWAKLEND